MNTVVCFVVVVFSLADFLFPLCLFSKGFRIIGIARSPHAQSSTKQTMALLVEWLIDVVTSASSTTARKEHTTAAITSTTRLCLVSF